MKFARREEKKKRVSTFKPSSRVKAVDDRKLSSNSDQQPSDSDEVNIYFIKSMMLLFVQFSIYVCIINRMNLRWGAKSRKLSTSDAAGNHFDVFLLTLF